MNQTSTEIIHDVFPHTLIQNHLGETRAVGINPGDKKDLGSGVIISFEKAKRELAEENNLSQNIGAQEEIVEVNNQITENQEEIEVVNNTTEDTYVNEVSQPKEMANGKIFAALNAVEEEYKNEIERLKDIILEKEKIIANFEAQKNDEIIPFVQQEPIPIDGYSSQKNIDDNIYVAGPQQIQTDSGSSYTYKQAA